ncbi:unnamed protein product [Alternaria alternata]
MQVFIQEVQGFGLMMLEVFSTTEFSAFFDLNQTHLIQDVSNAVPIFGAYTVSYILKKLC